MQNIIFPNKCIYCAEIIPLGAYLCETCRDELPIVCDTNLPQNSSKIDKMLSAIEYEGIVPNALREFKFRGKPRLADYFAGMLYDFLQEELMLAKIDLICYVPMYKTKERDRGYNQAKLLAESISQMSKIECKPLLKKVKNNRFQHSLSASERRSNVLGVYAVPDEQAVQGKRILLIDDILTTGSTINECARTLKESGAEYVLAATVARAMQ